MKSRHRLFVVCRLAIIVARLILLTALTGCSTNESSQVETDRDSLYQVSTYGALSRDILTESWTSRPLDSKATSGWGPSTA